MPNQNKLEEMTFGSYYQSLDKEHKTSLKNNIMENFGISYPTFYSKLSRGNYSPLEKKEIERLCGMTFTWE